MYNQFIEAMLIALVAATFIGIGVGALLGYALYRLEVKQKEESDND
jgi:putative flippase GtrA